MTQSFIPGETQGQSLLYVIPADHNHLDVGETEAFITTCVWTAEGRVSFKAKFQLAMI